MGKTKQEFRKGAASFYIVAIATLILVIIATGFAMVIINEVTRTSNDDLSQSAYDSALAGVEDAKVAYAKYMDCVARGIGTDDVKPSGNAKPDCSDIRYWVKHPDCYMVGHILGRIPKTTEAEVPISETIGKNNLDQAYTCTQFTTKVDEVVSSISENNPDRVIKVSFAQPGDAASINKVKISWHSNKDGTTFYYSNFDYGLNGGRVVFKPLGESGVSTPPTLAVQMVQTATSYKLSDFENSVNDRTDRATIYMVPCGTLKNLGGTTKDCDPKQNAATYKAAFDKNVGTKNVISASDIASTNNKNTPNLPFLVYCNGSDGSDYACSVTLELPKPVNGDRNGDTFAFVVSLPYGQPETNFQLEFFCKDGGKCKTASGTEEADGDYTPITTDKVQVKIDSTGRANDLYRRVEARLNSEDDTFSYPLLGIQLLGGSQTLLEKALTVTSEKSYDSYSSYQY